MAVGQLYSVKLRNFFRSSSSRMSQLEFDLVNCVVVMNFMASYLGLRMVEVYHTAIKCDGELANCGTLRGGTSKIIV